MQKENCSDKCAERYVEISPQQAEWSQSHTLGSQLPYVFENGLQFNGFNAKCSGCMNQVESANLRGSLTHVSDNRCVLVAKGYCQPCNGITSYSFILTAGDELKAEIFDADIMPGSGGLN
ncbi:hypothetical protein [Aliikangiella maris]|uniref:Uncharacterized protein n=2 Tax=Aliikangiella maris TaxID=3162458 RepID=A0ABV3MS34_9GAMM